MAEHEPIFRGSPAEFESAVRAFDSQLAERHGHRRRMLIYKTAWPPAPPGAPEVAVVVSDQPLGAGNGWDMTSERLIAHQWRAVIVAHTLPAGRSRLIFHCEEAIPEAEHHWRDLLGELARLGYIESDAAPEPVAQKPKRGGGRRSDYTDTERREICEEYLALGGGGMTQPEFMKRYGMSDRALRDWKQEFGL